MLGAPTSGKSSLVRELVLRGVGRGFVDQRKKMPPEWKPFRKKIVKTFEQYPGLKTLPGKTTKALSAACYGDDFNGPIVYDELVAQCGLSLAIRHEPWQWYFEEMPMPGLLVYLYCSNETLVNRNEARGERSHIEKTMRAVGKLEEIMAIIGRREGKVLQLNTDNLTTKECAKEVLQCL